MVLDIQPVTKGHLLIVKQLAYNYELDPQETWKENLDAQLAKLSCKTCYTPAACASQA